MSPDDPGHVGSGEDAEENGRQWSGVRGGIVRRSGGTLLAAGVAALAALAGVEWIRGGSLTVEELDGA